MTKILLVEDDKSLREIYGVRLLAEGYDIVSAGDGEEALAMAIKERPNLIVSDVMMPKISGFDMLDILRSTTETKDIKVIMMTALSSEDQRQRGERLGADRYLVKSQVGIEDVVRTVHEVLGDIPSAAPAAPTPIPQAPAAAPQQQPAPAPQPIPAQPVASPVPTAPTAPHIPERPSVESLSPQPVQPNPVAAPQNPFTAPTSTPVAPTASSQSTGLPQPTAPFSSQTPRPSNLGDRIIHPIDTPSEDQGPDLAQLMEQELSNTGLAPISITATPPIPEQTPPSTVVSESTPVSMPQPPMPLHEPLPLHTPEPIPPSAAQQPVSAQPAAPTVPTAQQPAPNPFPPVPPQQ